MKVKSERLLSIAIVILTVGFFSANNAGVVYGDVLNVTADGIGIGTASPGSELEVIGKAKFDVGTGSISVTTPGGWPGVIALSQNGNRREIVFRDEGIQILTSSTSSPSANDNGIFISETGRIYVKVIEISGAYFSEKFDISTPSDLKDSVKPEDCRIEEGMAACIDPENPGKLLVSSKEYDRTVAGVISGAGGIRTGMLMRQKGTAADGEYPVAISGRVYCKADAKYGQIKPGDLLTTSGTPGHVMKVSDYSKAHGATIGKAMTALEEGTGLVLTLVSLQ